MKLLICKRTDSLSIILRLRQFWADNFLIPLIKWRLNGNVAKLCSYLLLIEITYEEKKNCTLFPCWKEARKAGKSSW